MKSFAWALGALAGCLGLTASPPETPDAVVIFTGDIRGYLSPCGCSDPMIGGVERMAGVVRQLKKQPNAIYVDLGNWLEGYDRQEQLKAEALAQTWKSLEPAYLNVSARDALLGDGYLAALRGIVGGAIDSAEVVSPAMPGTPNVVKLDLAISGISTASADALDVATEMPRVVLVAGSLDVAKRAAERGGAGLYVYSLQGDPPHAPIVDGDATFVTVGDHCRYVGKIELRDGKWTEFRLIELGPEHAGDVQAIDAYRAYLRRVTGENLLAGVPKGKNGASFVGSDACMPCHQEDYDIWKKSLHAVAYKTLQKTGNDRDPECVSCHVVGLEHETGFTSVEKQPAMASVGCESCHGAGSKHIESPYKEYKAGGEKSCLPCHEPEHSPNFSYKEYWEKIDHGQGQASARSIAAKVLESNGKSQGLYLSELGKL
ncbi:MAG: cytochrome c family protein, partial [Fimbriimonadales bacterium]